MSTKMTAAQKDTAQRDIALKEFAKSAFAALFNVEAVQFGDYKYAIPATVNDEVWKSDKAEKAEIAEDRAEREE